MNAIAFRCPTCAGDLDARADGFRCRSCAADWPVRLDVPVFVPGMTVAPSDFTVPTAAWSDLCRFSGFADTPAMHDTLRTIFASEYLVADLHLAAENSYFFRRLQDLEKHLPPKPPAPPVAVGGVLRYRIERDFLPESFSAEWPFTWSVRFVNAGAAPNSAPGERPVSAICRWRTLSGSVIDASTTRTTLPIDLKPGHALTLPTWIAPPARPDVYLLEVGLAYADGTWLGGEPLRRCVRVVCGVPSLPPEWMTLDTPVEKYDYVEDHRIGQRLLREEFARHGVAQPRILEIGACCEPMTVDMAHEVYVNDIDVQTLQIGHLKWRDKHPRIRFFASDAARLPFADETFDAVVLFAAIHHMPDPVACLREFRRVVRRDGFVMMGTEPVGTYRAETVSPQLLRELENGINEQVFNAQEYVRMFAEAGLFAHRAEIEYGALRVFLRPEPALAHADLRQTPPPPLDESSLGMRQLARLNLSWMKRQFRRRIRPLLPFRKAG